jgi:hypothetical protein
MAGLPAADGVVLLHQVQHQGDDQQRDADLRARHHRGHGHDQVQQ